MKSTCKIIGILFVCLSVTLGLTACEEENGENNGEACSSDADCLEGEEGCISSQCIPLCEDAGDCGVDESCVPRPDGGAGMICETGEQVHECDDEGDCLENETCEEDASVDSFGVCEEVPHGQPCNDHDDCRTDEICGNDDVCIPLGDLAYHTVQIEDVTDIEGDADRCDDETYGFATSGVKVFDIQLVEAGTSNVVAHATTIDFLEGSHDSQGTAFFGDPYMIFDGTAPDFEHFCPDPETFTRLDNSNDVTSTFHENAVVALGCGGELFVQFHDDSGQPRVLDESYDIDVYVYGQFCSEEYEDEHGGTHQPQSTDDPYDVYICTHHGGGSGPVNDPESDCDVRLTDEPARGFGLFPVVLPF